jgi:uncharacterized protein
MHTRRIFLKAALAAGAADVAGMLIGRAVRAQTADPAQHPNGVPMLRKRRYTGSEPEVIGTLPNGAGFTRVIARYSSDALNVDALLTRPRSAKPQGGWPAIVFNHGYIAPGVYKTGNHYNAWVAAFARAGYVVFMPDYRGHAQSGGSPSAGYGSVEYTSDVINAFRSVQKHADVDPRRVGMFGHSMGAGLALRAMAITPDIKAGVLAAGVIGSYYDLINNWQPYTNPAANAWRNGLLSEFGGAADDQAFWDVVSPTAHLGGIAPLQIQHGGGDAVVAPKFSSDLAERLARAGATHELHLYRGDDHNFRANLSLMLRRALAFFGEHL